MPSVKTLEQSVTYIERFIRNSPLTFKNSGELAFDSADWVKQFILSAPFAWRWNRGYVPTITCVAGHQDYQVNIPDFGWLERASLNFPVVVGQPGKSIELKNELVVASEQFSNEPTTITAQVDDDNGNITFRLFPPPDTEYTLSIIYQKAASNFTSLQQTWYPIPDYMSYIYHQGLKALAYEYIDDERFGFALQFFVQQLVAANNGLSETEKNIFLEQRMDTLREQRAVESGIR